MQAKWHLHIVEREGPHQAVITTKNGMGLVEFSALADFLEFLAFLPRTRVYLDNPEALQALGVPIVVDASGKMSRAATIRNLYKRHSSREIAMLTGLPEATVYEWVSRFKKRETITS